MEKISVIYIFPRSGGTLLNRCLGTHLNNKVLSEVSPRHSIKKIIEQSYEWLDLLTREEYLKYKDIDVSEYAEIMQLLNSKANNNGSKLIIRDFTYLGETVESQRKYGLDLNEVVFTRDLRQSFVSYNRVLKKKVSLDEFAERSLKYAESVKYLPKFKYEEFCEAPEKILKQLTDTLNVYYPKNFTTEYHKYLNCRGDRYNEKLSTNFYKKTIQSPSMHKIEEEITQHKKLRLANEILGYKY